MHSQVATTASSESSRRQKPRASFSSPTQVAGPRHLGHFPLVSQVREQGTGQEVEQLGLELAPVWNADAPGVSLLAEPQCWPLGTTKLEPLSICAVYMRPEGQCGDELEQQLRTWAWLFLWPCPFREVHDRALSGPRLPVL